jgi:C_GCAxxG_C_C family probable redox protein
MFVGKALQTYQKTNNYSCSEALIHAANDYYDLGLDEKSFKMMSAFSGGMYSDQTCGALVGASAVLGVLYSTGRAHDSELMRRLVKELVSRFDHDLGATRCEELKSRHKTDELRCECMVKTAAAILEDLIARHPVE